MKIKSPKFKNILDNLKGKLYKFGQLIYLTCLNFNDNQLYESANSCSFGFIFSFAPLPLMTLTLMVGLLRNSKTILNYVLKFIEQFKNVFDLTPVLKEVMNMKSLSVIDFVLAIWVIWMARKLFATVVQAMSRIFKSVTKRNTLWYQLIMFVIEFLLIFIIIALIIGIFCLNRLNSFPVFQQLNDFLPLVFLAKLSTNAEFVIYSIIFVFTALIYKLGPGVEIKRKTSIFYAALSTISFYITSRFIRFFFNSSNYSLVYGAISSLIILMILVWFFFSIFLFCAQMMHSRIFLDSLSFGVLYLAPVKENELTKWGKFILKVFRKPVADTTKYSTKTYKQGDKIFSAGENADYVYYIRSGNVTRISAENKTSVLKEGSFFGEIHCILNQTRTDTATAKTECSITAIKSHDFIKLLRNNPKASAKAISKVSKYTAELYENEQ